MAVLVFMIGVFSEYGFCEKEDKTPSFFVLKLEYFPHFLYTIVTGGWNNG